MRDATLEATALRFAAGDLPPDDHAAFASRLATDEAAQDALAEAVRLSAAAIGQATPAPNLAIREQIRERVRRRRVSAVAWVALGAGAVAVATVAGLYLGQQPPSSQPPGVMAVETPETPVAPEPRLLATIPEDSTPTMAEIWAELSTPEQVEKAHDEEIRRRQRMRDLRQGPSLFDAREP